MQLARQMDEQRERSQLGHAQVISQFGDRDQSGVACRRQIEHADAHYVPGQPLGCVFPGSSSSTVAVHEARQNDRRIVLGSGWVDSGRVFTLADGSPLRPSWIGKRFVALYTAAGLQSVRLHDFWHLAYVLTLDVRFCGLAGVME